MSGRWSIEDKAATAARVEATVRACASGPITSSSRRGWRTTVRDSRERDREVNVVLHWRQQRGGWEVRVVGDGAAVVCAAGGLSVPGGSVVEATVRLLLQAAGALLGEEWS